MLSLFLRKLREVRLKQIYNFTKFLLSIVKLFKFVYYTLVIMEQAPLKRDISITGSSCFSCTFSLVSANVEVLVPVSFLKLVDSELLEMSSKSPPNGP